MKYIPTRLEIIRTDQILFFLIQFVCIFFLGALVIALYMHFPYIDMQANDYFDIFILPFTMCVPIPYVLFRYKWIKNLFIYGEEVSAEVLRVEDHLKPWFFLKYGFTYNNNLYTRLVILMYTPCTKIIARESKFIIMMDPLSKRSYIRDVFGCQD
jgi:hypothetical protein